MKGTDIIQSAARLAGIIAIGEVLSGDIQAECLTILQDMMDSWQADGLLIYGEQINSFPLTVGQQTYKLGTGGDFNMPRPAKIDRIGVLIPNGPSNYELPMAVLDYNEWAKIVLKQVLAVYPLNCYPDYANTFSGGVGPYMNLNFWVIPSGPCGVNIYSWQPIPTWPDLNTTDVRLPPAYSKAVRYNLAIDLAAEFPGLAISPAVAAQAQLTLGIIKSINLPDPLLSTDSMYSPSGSTQGVYDWRTDTWVGQTRR